MTTLDFYSLLADFVAPRSCAVCGCRLMPDEGVVCTPCYVALPRTGFASSPYDNEMARVFWGRTAVERCAAMWFHKPGSASARIIYALKYGSRPDIGQWMGAMAAQEMAAGGFFDGVDLIVPVPLDRRRMARRGYNQSAEIAAGMGRAVGIEVCGDALVRLRPTASQTLTAYDERAANVEGAFGLRDEVAVRGRHVLLVDDIVTTGATACACAAVLAAAPGTKVSIAALGFTKN